MPTITPERINSAQAMNTYIKELCTSSPYAYNMRLHKVQSHKSQSNDTRLGLTLDGIDVYEVWCCLYKSGVKDSINMLVPLHLIFKMFWCN